MPEKSPAFTVTDRRKFTADGALREGAVAAEDTPPASAPPAAVSSPTGAASAEADVAVDAIYDPPPSRVVTMPAPPSAEPAPPEDLQQTMEDEALEGDALPEPTAAESAEQHAAYRESSLLLDNLLRQQNPGMKTAAAVTIEHVIQSIYLSAVVAMGAAAEPGQKPRIDILGARQSIDMLTVLEEKTRGNLDEKEQRLLQNMLFELRMMFLEITNAIAQQAHTPPPIGKK
jgi:hypothetical protein